MQDGQRQRKLLRVPLGPASLTRAEAERLRDDYLAVINQAHVGIGGAIWFRDFARIYEWDVFPTLASTTRERSQGVLKNYLIPEFGDLMLREMTLERQALKSDGPHDLVFQSPVQGTPIRDNNILVRHIKPAARRLGIEWVNWQVLRRSCATWLNEAGVDVKSAQGILRHSRASTTQGVYQQMVPESQRKAVRKLTEYVRSVVPVPVVGRGSFAGARSKTHTFWSKTWRDLNSRKARKHWGWSAFRCCGDTAFQLRHNFGRGPFRAS